MRTLRSLSVFSVAGLACIMGSCAENAVVPSPVEFEQTSATKAVSVDFHKTEFDPESFTTEGKPTKTIETPCGPREVYDIRKDPEVKQAVNIVYENGDVTFRDISSYLLKYEEPESFKSEVEYLRQSRMVSYYDLLRIGCKSVSKLPCQRNVETYLNKGCGLENLGSPTFSEKEKSQLVSVAEFGASFSKPITEDIRKKAKWDTYNGSNDTPTHYSAIDFAGCKMDSKSLDIEDFFYLGPTSDLTPIETFEIVTSFSCRQWIADFPK